MPAPLLNLAMQHELLDGRKQATFLKHILMYLMHSDYINGSWQKMGHVNLADVRDWKV